MGPIRQPHFHQVAAAIIDHGFHLAHGLARQGLQCQADQIGLIKHTLLRLRQFLPWHIELFALQCLRLVAIRDAFQHRIKRTLHRFQLFDRDLPAGSRQERRVGDQALRVFSEACQLHLTFKPMRLPDLADKDQPA